MNPRLTFEQVVDIVHDLFKTMNTPRFYDANNQTAIIRKVWIEHCCIPDLPVTSIAQRLITGYMTNEEMGFWREHAAK